MYVNLRTGVSSITFKSNGHPNESRETEQYPIYILEIFVDS